MFQFSVVTVCKKAYIQIFLYYCMLMCEHYMKHII